MEDEDLVHLNNVCADLVSLAKFEAFPSRLLADKQGEWGRVREVCSQLGLKRDDVPEALFATWLSDPVGDEDYVLILFYEEVSTWSLAARYNRKRLAASATMGNSQSGRKIRETA